ncbi:thermonuclease family protein [Enterococcus sp. BWR-S5]|uniref:thermonuclease family protein n=1 Tax=Enterococcus sp. BWR-S5 TaxID=2787714 RepID=UPI0019212B30|nr:thermonuclease family protein [Enterococcus sp. BWR-S5]MBL1227269.1 thermonuclease family protein [Enterococcus sp. BWR-S5]
MNKKKIGLIFLTLFAAAATIFSQSKESGNKELPREELITVSISKFVDGDTTEFIHNGEKMMVRFLLIDTPETVKPNTEVQPFGKEASHRTKELLENAKKVELMFDQGKILEDTKKWEPRYLAYVFVDGNLVQEILIREGLAKIAYIDSENTKFLKDLEMKEQQAKENKLGIWSISTNIRD